MEKRFVLFIILTMLIVVGYNALVVSFGPPPKVAQDDKQKQAEPGQDAQPGGAGDQPNADGKTAATQPADATKAESPSAEASEKPTDTAAVAAAQAAPHRVISLGSYQSANGSPLLVTFNSRGAALERVELVGRDAAGKLLYRDLDNMGGYLGNLSLVAAAPSGCRVQVVPPGTPAASANPSDSAAGVGLRVDDLLLALDGKRLATVLDLEEALAYSKPGQTVKLTVERNVGGSPKSFDYTVVLDVRPFELIQPEPLDPGELRPHPLSLLLTVRNATNDHSGYLEEMGQVDWEIREVADGVEFHYVVDEKRATEVGLAGPLEIIKRFRLGKPPAVAADQTNVANILPYHLRVEVEFRNQSDKPQKIAYRLTGTNGLPTEGWWYLSKIHPGFSSAGARDIVLSTEQGGHQLIGCSAIAKRARKEEKSPETPLFGESEATESRSLSYIGIDTQYFAAALMPISPEQGQHVAFARAEAMTLGDIAKTPKGWERTINITYALNSEPIALEPAAGFTREFQLFTGPKEPHVLAQYHLSDWIYYGWFGPVSRFLAGILHFFHDMVENYAIAIILLTVLVRGCMFPLSRKAAKNAAMMQELAPEMKKIAEKYKNNMEARGRAQQELFRKNNYNPFSGCWMMFLQLPVFIGLYRCLAVDIRLRQAPLIPGIEWASNLAGPDKLFYWKSGLFSFLTDESGWLGPYFNLLPIFTIALFLVHQKLFTPPATDEQTAMQLKMMKFMTIFMGVLFYKVPAGLCIYFISSSLWGIAERKLLPKPAKKTAAPESPAAPPRKSLLDAFMPKSDTNGSSGPPNRRRRDKRPRR